MPRRNYDMGGCRDCDETLRLEEAEYNGRTVTLNKPFRDTGGSKKFGVYVKNDKGNVVKVSFGDKDMEIKRDDPEARKSFRARHNCDQKKDKTTAGYWSCKFWQSSKSVSELLAEGVEMDYGTRSENSPPKDEPDTRSVEPKRPNENIPEELWNYLSQDDFSPTHAPNVFTPKPDLSDRGGNKDATGPINDEPPAHSYDQYMKHDHIGERVERLDENRQQAMDWIADNDTGGSVSALYRKYVSEVDDPTSVVTFRKYVGDARGNGRPASRAAAPQEQKPEYDEFEQEILNGEVLLRYEMIEEVIRGIVTWSPYQSNAFIYGTGGVGKTYQVMTTVQKFGNSAEIEVFKGAISGFTGLLQVLYDNRREKIIIFDDNDGLIAGGNQNALNILKGAMDSSEPRIISYVRFRRGAPSREGVHIEVETGRLKEKLVAVYENGELLFEENVSEEDALWLAKRAGWTFEERINLFPRARHIMESLSDDLDGDDDEDFDDNEGDDDGTVPDRFRFESRIIFISNLLKVPQPLMDRCVLIGVILTKEQILDRIELILDNLLSHMPEVTLETKKFTLEFMRKYRHRIDKPLTFRMFEQVAKMFQDLGTNKRAMKLAYLSMRGEGQSVVLGR